MGELKDLIAKIIDDIAKIELRHFNILKQIHEDFSFIIKTSFICWGSIFCIIMFPYEICEPIFDIYKCFTAKNFLINWFKKGSYLRGTSAIPFRIKLALWSPRCNINYTDELGDTALHVATRQGNYDYMKFLLENGASPNIQNTIGQTPLFIAVDQLNDTNIDLLLSFKTNINLVDTDGYPCLRRLLTVPIFGRKFLYDSYCGSYKTVFQKLIDHNIDMSIVLKNGVSCFQLFKNNVDDYVNLWHLEHIYHISGYFTCLDILTYIKNREVGALMELRADKNSLFYEEYFHKDVFQEVLKNL